MRWSPQKPWEEGFYWYRENGIDDVVRVYRSAGEREWLATGSMYERRLVRTMNGEWAGPLASPRERLRMRFSRVGWL